MKFRILDLFLLTTFIAVAAATYKHDLVAFHQLTFFASICAGATTACILMPRKKNWPIFAGALGGVLGGIIFLAIAHAMDMDSYMSFFWRPIDLRGFAEDFLFEVQFVLIVSPAIGAAIGPLLTSHLRKVELPEKIKRSRLISWALLGGAALLLFFEMIDRIEMRLGGRDWSSLIGLLIFGFVAYTVAWNRELIVSRQIAETKPVDEATDQARG